MCSFNALWLCSINPWQIQPSSPTWSKQVHTSRKRISVWAGEGTDLQEVQTEQTSCCGTCVRGRRHDVVLDFGQRHWCLRLLHGSCGCTFPSCRPPERPVIERRPHNVHLRRRQHGCTGFLHRQGGSNPVCLRSRLRNFPHFFHLHRKKLTAVLSTCTFTTQAACSLDFYCMGLFRSHVPLRLKTI